METSLISSIRSKVEARVAEALLPALFDRAVKQHEKHAWRDCDCDWCARKRLWHGYLQFAPHGQRSRGTREQWRYLNVSKAREELKNEEQRILS